MTYTIRELWNGEWWRWYMEDGKPRAFVKDGDATLQTVRQALDFDLSDLAPEERQHTGAAARMWRANFNAWKETAR